MATVQGVCCARSCFTRAKESTPWCFTPLQAVNNPLSFAAHLQICIYILFLLAMTGLFVAVNKSFLINRRKTVKLRVKSLLSRFNNLTGNSRTERDLCVGSNSYIQLVLRTPLKKKEWTIKSFTNNFERIILLYSQS